MFNKVSILTLVFLVPSVAFGQHRGNHQPVTIVGAPIFIPAPFSISYPQPRYAVPLSSPTAHARYVHRRELLRQKKEAYFWEHLFKLPKKK